MLLPFLWIAAFLFSLPLVEPYEIARLLGVTCAVFAAGVTVVRYGVPRWSPLIVAGALFWALAGLSVALSDIRYLSFVSFCTFSLMPLSALAFAAAPERALRVAGIAAGGILGMLALWAVVQFLWIKDMLVFGQVRWPFANPNSYAALLGMGVFPALGAAMMVAGWRRTLLLVLAGLLAMAVVVIGSRAVTLLLLPAAALFLLMVRGQGVQKTALLVLAAGLAAGIIIAVSTQGAAIMRLISGDGAGVFFGRGPIWQGAVAMLGAHGVTGTGIGMFSQYYPVYRLSTDTVSGGYMVHNDPLQFAVEMGWAAPVLFYAFLILAARRTWRAMTAPSPVMAGVFCGLSLMVVHAHGDFDFYVASILCLAGLMLAVWYRQTGGGIVLSPTRWAAVVPLAAGLVLLQGLLIADYHVRGARGLAMAGDMDEFGAHINAAHDKSFGMNAQAYVMAATVPMGLMHGAKLADRPALHAQASALLDRAQAQNPRLVSVPYYRAQLAALHRPDSDPGAEEWLRRALALNPLHTPSRVMLAQRLRGAGQKDEAYDVLRAGLDWPYGTPEARDFYEELGVQALLRQDMETYARMNAAANLLEARLRSPVVDQPSGVGAMGAGRDK